MCNATYERTLMHLRKRINISLINDATKLNDFVKKPNFISSKVFNENLVAVHTIKQKLYMNQPRYVADSLCYDIRTEDFYQDKVTCREQFDLSGMKIEKFKDSENKKVVGKFKDETQGIPICEFIGLRSKMYFIKLDDDSEKKTAKGIVRNVIKNISKHAKYKHVLDTGERMTSSMKLIRSFDHYIYTVNVTKISLSAYDVKRFIQDDGISSYACGHYATPTCEKQVEYSGATA